VGASAASYCHQRAQGEINLLNWNELSHLSPQKNFTIFRSGNGTVIPMLDERQICLRELGQGLQDWYEFGLSKTFIGKGMSAVQLVKSLAERVLGFNDVHFYKRAQLAAKMISDVLADSGHGELPDLDQLTIFADYRLPQILREKGIIVYEPSLAMRVDEEEELAAGSIEELSIRAATVWGGEYIRQEMERLSGVKATSAQIDSFLWLEARRLKDSMRPHHRTRTINY